MLFLRKNVLPYRRQLRFAHGEGAISALPLETILRPGPFIQPLGRIGFDEPNDLGDRLIRPNLHEEMHVVVHCADLEQDSALLAKNSADVFKQFRPELSGEQRRAVARGEDNMEQQIGECPGHSGDPPAVHVAPSGLIVACPVSGGLRLRLHHVAPLGLRRKLKTESDPTNVSSSASEPWAKHPYW